ncbi:hypothetical protein [Candidatus Amarobacter glycogenicus]
MLPIRWWRTATGTSSNSVPLTAATTPTPFEWGPFLVSGDPDVD